MLDVWDVVQGCALFDLFQHGLHLLEQRVLADLLQVFRKAPTKDDLHRLAPKSAKISSRLTISVPCPSLVN
jgi:hypothetical protein